MHIPTQGIDIAKNVFHLHDTNAQGKVALKKRLRRAQLLAYMQKLPPCRVGMEGLWKDVVEHIIGPESLKRS